jgi:hypothetical protein
LEEETGGMIMDLSKLMPTPWTVHRNHCEDAYEDEYFVKFSGGIDDLSTDSSMMDQTHAEFIALARNAFDVMLRRGWGLVKTPHGWAFGIRCRHDLYGAYQIEEDPGQ